MPGYFASRLPYCDKLGRNSPISTYVSRRQSRVSTQVPIAWNSLNLAECTCGGSWGSKKTHEQDKLDRAPNEGHGSIAVDKDLDDLPQLVHALEEL